MKNQFGLALRLIAATGFFIALSAPAPISAQPSAQREGQATAGPPRDIRPPVPKTSKQSPAKQSAAQKRPAPKEAAAEPWTLEHALPGGPNGAARANRREVPTLSSPRLGRIPLETGSFGLETETQLKPNEFYDGRPTPGLETVKNREPSYFGLSLSVPANDPLFLPLLRPPRE